MAHAVRRHGRLIHVITPGESLLSLDGVRNGHGA